MPQRHDHERPLIFSQWDKIFNDAMTTAAAIDRLVHHSIILELAGSSYRTEEATDQQRRLKPDHANHGGE